MGMEGNKRTYPSEILGRPFHFDLFLPSDAPPEFTCVLFGGSGKTQEEYERRAKSVVPVFTQALEEVEREFPFAFVYYTAPFDVAYGAFEDRPDEAERWQRHVSDELIPNLPDGRLFASAYSGGAALALAGFAEHPRCFGGRMLGADQLPQGWARPEEWESPLYLVYNHDDRVYQKNALRIRELEKEEAVRVVRTPSGGHPVEDYIEYGAFAGLLRFARRDLPPV